MNIAPKTIAAAGAGSLSIAIVEILAWILSYWNISMPPAVGASIATVLAVFASYLAPHHTPTPEEIKEIKEQPCDPPVANDQRWNTQN